MAKDKGSEKLRRFVKARRQFLNLTQTQFTEKGGLSYGLVGMIESGKHQGKPRKESLIKLAKALKLPAETTGDVVNFLQLLLADRVPEGALDRVAQGAQAARVMSELIHTPAEQFDDFPSLPSKYDRLDQVIHVLEEDLEPDDFDAVAHLLRKFYKLTHGV